MKATNTMRNSAGIFFAKGFVRILSVHALERDIRHAEDFRLKTRQAGTARRNHALKMVGKSGATVGDLIIRRYIRATIAVIEPALEPIREDIRERHGGKLSRFARYRVGQFGDG